MEMTVSVEREIVEYCSGKNLLVEPGAVKLLCGQKDFKKTVDLLSEENVFVLTEEKIRQAIAEKELVLEIPKVVIKDSSFHPSAKETAPQFRIMEEYEVSKQSRSAGKIDSFLEMFLEKHDFLAGLLKKRANLEIKPISRLAHTSKNNHITVCGMVSKKWTSKNGHEIVELEDREGKCLCLFPESDKQLLEQCKYIVADDVIAIKGKALSSEMIIAQEVHWPELSIKPIKTIEQDLSIVAISDIHVGSKTFLEKEFMKFIEWINGNAESGREKEEAGKVKYIVVTGDNVDGIGVYPEQYDELAIKDIFEQYEAFCGFLEQIPEHIEIFICPGQHDAVRRADPQPAVPKEFVKNAAYMKNVHFVGSPSWIEIEGLKTMLYHGASLQDIYSAVPGLDRHKPQEVMSLLLKKRDLMAPYGMKQPYAPEKRNAMLVREEPDLYFGGDMHHNGYSQYRACTIINSGTWQARTAFQVQMGFIPTPAIAVQVNLKTRKISEKRFE